MKTALAVAAACVFMLIGWLVLAALLFGVLHIASQAREGVGILHLLNILAIWVLGPGFGGFCATYITPRVFTTVDASSIFTSFITVVIVLGIVMTLLSFVAPQPAGILVWQLVLLVVQVSAIVIGAQIGKRVYLISNA